MVIQMSPSQENLEREGGGGIDLFSQEGVRGNLSGSHKPPFLMVRV